MTRSVAALALSLIVASACATRVGPRRFELHGQVLALQPDQLNVTVKHDDIRGFMPAMTMAFNVRDRRLLDPLAPGDLIVATLVVLDDGAYLSAVQKIGHAELPRPAPPQAEIPVLREGDALPDAAFTDQDGRTVRLSSLAGSAVVLTFIYTRCPLPNYCPLMDRHFATIQRAVKGGGAGKVRLLSITFDPAFDTPAVLKAHAAAVGADLQVWSFLTGDRNAIEAFGARLGLAVIREPDDPSNLTHNLRTAVIDRRGRLMKIYNGNEWTPDEILADLGSKTPS